MVVEALSFVDYNFAPAALIVAAAGEMAGQIQLSLYPPHDAVVRILAIGSVKSCRYCLYRPILHYFQKFHTCPGRCGALGDDPFPLAPSWNRASSG